MSAPSKAPLGPAGTPPPRPPSLRRELQAIGVLYVFLCILPLLLGLLLAP